jgi:capsular polysaccharide biosynthesis protein
LSYFSEKLAKYLVPAENPTEYIYAGRDDSDCRLLLNQDEVIAYLNQNDIPIKKVKLTGMPYMDQVNLFRDAKLVMTISGSGSTNQIYCNPSKAKILFVSPKDGELNCSFATAKAMNMGYSCLQGYENFVPDNVRRASDKTCSNFKLKKEDVLEHIKSLLLI